MKIYVLVISLCCLLSLLLFVGILDKDFFSYYYIGREAALYHKEFFRDFAENKGIGTYVYFTVLYSIFRNHWMAALIFSNILFNSISILLTIAFVRGIRIGKTYLRLDHTALITVLVLVLTSCSIGSLLSGIYTTNVGYPFLMAALICFQRKRFFWSGVLFGVCVLTRQSFMFFAPVFLTLPALYGYSFKKSFGWYIAGGLASLLFLLVYGIANHSLEAIYENMFLYALYYAQSSNSSQKVYVTVISILYQPIFVVTCIYLLLMTGVVFKTFLKFRSFIVYTTALLICSLVATFSAGVFYFHHFLQVMPYFALILALQNTYWQKYWLIVSVMFIQTALVTWYVYTSIFQTSNWYQKFDDPLIHKKKYLQIVPYFPRYYFDFDKSSPDRYFNSFFIVPYSNSHYEIDAKRHALLTDSQLNQTAFLFIDSDPNDRIMIQQYLSYYSSRFHLKKVRQQKIRGLKFSVYESSTQ